MSSASAKFISLLVSFTVLTFSSPAASRPGGGGRVMGAARGVGAGGLVVDYSQALRTRDLDVTWDARKGTLKYTAGVQANQLVFKPWEMRDLLRLALDTTIDGQVEVSVDRVDTKRNFYASPPLMLGDAPSPVGDWLQQADLEFAAIASLGPSTPVPELLALAPGARAQTLLETDGAYQMLTRDVVRAPFPWPMLVFKVGALDRPNPVQWQAVFRPQFMTPDGQTLEAEPDHPWIEPWMEAEALRPYEGLKLAVETTGGRELIRSYFPTVTAAERYALGMAVLDTYCAGHRRACQTWKDALPAAKTEPAKVHGFSSEVDELKLVNTWDKVRLQVASREKDPEFRCWIFVDEALYAINVKPRYTNEEMLGLLPKGQCATREPGVGVRLLTPALRFIKELAGKTPSESTLMTAMTDITTTIRGIDKAKALSADAKDLWKDRAGYVLLKLLKQSERFTGVQTALDVTAANVFEACVDDLRSASAIARSKPTARTAEAWRLALGRTVRCRWYPEEDRLLTSASFHYAIGVHEAKLRTPEAAMHSRDRLRMLVSHAVQAKGSEAKAIDELVAKLRTKIR